MKNVVYQIKNLITNKVYVGSTIYFPKRKGNHIWLLKNNKHHSIALQRAWNKYGADNFIFEIIEVVNGDRCLLIEREQFFINQRGLKKGYNMYPIAESPSGRICSQELKEKFRKRAIGNKYHFGKNHTNETKIVIKGKLTDYYNNHIHPKKGTGKRIGQFDKCGNFLKEWSSGYEAAKLLDLKVGPIYQACNKNNNSNKTSSSYGFIWKFI